MDLFAVVDQVIELLRSRGRVSYRALQVQFNLDDAALDALKVELIEVHQIAVDQVGTMLVWTGDGGALPEPPSRIPEAQQPQPRAEPHASEAERRQLTVLFCELVDSTVLASSTPKGGVRWCGPIKRPGLRSSNAITVILPSTSAMACSSTSATPGPTKMTPNGP